MSNATPLYTGIESRNLDIPFPDDKVLLDVVFPDHTRQNLHSKTFVFDHDINSIDDVHVMEQVMYDNFEGKEPRPEMFMKPVALFKDPFRRGRHRIVFMEFYKTIDTPCIINTRPSCKAVLDKIQHLDPWFGIEQEYVILGKDNKILDSKETKQRIDFYTELGMSPSAGEEREMQELHMKACLYAGIRYAGCIREDGLSQWEYQIGPCKGIEIGDHLHISRYLLFRIAEMMGVSVSIKPKPTKSYGSGGHLNFSTNKMRAPGGIEHIKKAIEMLSLSDQAPLLKMYDPTFGIENEKRLKDSHWSPGVEFHAEIGDKWSSSVRIPSMVNVNGRGYLEDRRPPSNMDPYAATEGFVRACILGEYLKESK